MAVFEEVTRKKAKARIALIGPSGAGKTLSSLLLAYGITGDWSKIALIDTEHERARFYAERSDFGTGRFLYAPLYAPYTADRYIDYMCTAAQLVGENGVVIVDSFSHAWDNEGGVLDYKSEVEKRPGKTSYTAWDEAGKVQNNLVNSLLSERCHIIVTMRTKMAYAMETNEKGKMVPVKVGLAPIQRDNTEYEFDIVLQLNREHIATISKDTTFLDKDKWYGIITPELGEQLRDWLNDGVEPPRCADCQAVIHSDAKNTDKAIAEKATAKFGRILCVPCARKAAELLKQAANDNPAGISAETTNGAAPGTDHPSK